MDELMRNSLGRYADALAGLSSLVREQVLTGIESLTTQRPSLTDISFGPADAPGLEAEFTEIPHVGLDLALTSPSGERFAAAMLVPLPDLGGLLGIETGADRMADADFANAQLQVIAGATREYFDLLGMTLFQDQLAGIEIVPAEARVGGVETTVGLVQETAAGAPVIRIDLGLGLADGEPARLVLVVPQTFMDAIGVALGGGAAASAAEPAPLRAAPTGLPGMPGMAGAGIGSGLPGESMSSPFGLDSEPDNVSPFRPAGTFGAAAREDVDVHPVRFPPLSEPAHLSSERRALDLIMDVSMRVTVELGRASLTVEDVLGLGPGSVVELNKLAGEPVDVMVNDQLIARGEVVVVDENFGVRVTEIVSPRRRAQAMGA
ncbi:MAG: flagellar motor switch protein FliN [Dehalococcoidia bacterium]